MIDVVDNAARRVMRRGPSSCAGFAVWPGSAREVDAALSEVVEAGEELVVRPVAADRVGSRWGGAGDRLFFDFEVGVHVDLGGLDAFMAFSGVASVHHRRGRGGVGVAQVCATAVLGVGVRAMAVC